jgi:diguanylate cyclase (GGDEF)-like protein/PAS domain S-box-containing protein
MEKNNKLYHALIENCHEAIVLIDENFKVTYANQLNSDVLSYPKEELVGKNWMDLIFEEDKEYIIQLYSSLLTSSRKNMKIEYRVIDRLGSIKWIHAYINNLADEEHINSIVVTYSDVTAMKEDQKKLHQLAYSDGLEGIANRRLFQDRLKTAIAHAQRNNKRAAVILLDLDLIGSSNNEITPNIEELILKEAGIRLVHTLRQTDTVSRQGSDEFNIVLSDINTEEDAIIVTKKIYSTLTQPILIDKLEIVLKPYIGFSVYPDDADSSGQLTLYADIASSEAKNQEKSIVRISTKRSSMTKVESTEDLKNYIKNFKTETK